MLRWAFLLVSTVFFAGCASTPPPPKMAKEFPRWSFPAEKRRPSSDQNTYLNDTATEVVDKLQASEAWRMENIKTFGGSLNIDEKAFSGLEQLRKLDLSHKNGESGILRLKALEPAYWVCKDSSGIFGYMHTLLSKPDAITDRFILATALENCKRVKEADFISATRNR